MKTKSNMDKQKRWSRYCKAINYCITKGYFIVPEDSKNGNVKRIKVKHGTKQTSITLKPKKYTGTELYDIIHNAIG